MITKDEMIVRLRKLFREEESAIPIYTKHIESTFFLSHLSPKVQQEVRDTLLTLALESEVHARMFEAMVKKVTESKQDVY